MIDLGRQLAARLAEEPSRVPVLVGGCGTGRTRALLEVRDRLGPARAQYVDLARVATTPERFLRALLAHSPFRPPPAGAVAVPDAPQAAFERALAFLTEARTVDGEPATFLLDEFLEVRTFEHFPGLRHAGRDLLAALERTVNRFVLTSRLAERARRALSGHAWRRLVIWPVAPWDVGTVAVHIERTANLSSASGHVSALAQAVHALTAGRPLYVDAIVTDMARRPAALAPDPVEALVALLAPGGRLDAECRYRYEWRLQRARGYGALRGLLADLAAQQPATLSELARACGRTAGATKDYLTWLVDVDLVVVDERRYRFADPLLRTWVRLNDGPAPPSLADVAAAVRALVAAQAPPSDPPRLDHPGPTPTGSRRDPTWALIEID